MAGQGELINCHVRVLKLIWMSMQYFTDYVTTFVKGKSA